MHVDPAAGLLLVGHGTRSQIGRRQFLDLADRLATMLQPVCVEPAFLELAEPAIDAAVGRLLERGISRLVTLPLLLFAAGHAKDDVPAAVSAALARRARGDMPRVQAAHLGCHEAMLDLSRLRMEQATGGASPNGAVHLLVGRGSRDASATLEMYEFAGLRQAQSRIRTKVAFLAMARPLLEEQLARLATQQLPLVIVQPHLLFHGDLLDSLAKQVQAVKANNPGSEWVVAPILADEPGCKGCGTELLVAATKERFYEAVIRVVAPVGDD